MAVKKKTTKSKKKLDVKVKMIGELIDATGSSKDSWNPAEISDDMKAISYIRKLADTWNPAQLNEALKYLGFKTVDTWNPAEIEETKNKLVKYFLPTNASGNPIELDLKGALPYEATSLTIDLLPIQDLHGYDSPWVGGAGKNKLVYPYYHTTRESNGVTFTDNGDGSITLTGKSSGGSIFSLEGNMPIPNGNYILRVNTQGGSSSSVYVRLQVNSTDTANNYAINTDIPITISEGSIVLAQIRVQSDGEPNGCVAYPFLRLSTDTSTTWTPYSNICPISGRNSVTLTVNGEDTEITLPQTVYGGNVNVLEGGTSSTYGYIASYNGEELPGAWISDRDVYVAGTTPTTGAEVVYVLATPTELTTSAEEVTLINGENTLSTDGDTINITYKAILNS